ncbi:PPPDE domain-containing protein [Heracleum sosnowskyi]|uniref:PPPDE domain-containing protein n=1 Tax=Heracleum sosnowskyi TaxID=360622 RepID=A0AAD8I1Y0_9APIA|nr:PPPDE domain-containing protein [Heracleum sosnowskyi]
MKLFPLRFNSSKVQKGHGESSRAKLYLNVYDLSPVNNYLYWFGLGVYHSGIEVHGFEYGYGACEEEESGVYEVEARSSPGFSFRKSVLLGSTDLSYAELRLFMEDMSEKYLGNTYNFISKNCNHFTDEVCVRLTGKPIPRWVNRLAKLGSFRKCIPPQSIYLTIVGYPPDDPEWSDDGLDSGRVLLSSLEDSSYFSFTDSNRSTTSSDSEEEFDHHSFTTYSGSVSSNESEEELDHHF